MSSLILHHLSCIHKFLLQTQMFVWFFQNLSIKAFPRHNAKSISCLRIEAQPRFKRWKALVTWGTSGFIFENVLVNVKTFNSNPCCIYFVYMYWDFIWNKAWEQCYLDNWALDLTVRYCHWITLLCRQTGYKLWLCSWIWLNLRVWIHF